MAKKNAPPLEDTTLDPIAQLLRNGATLSLPAAARAVGDGTASGEKLVSLERLLRGDARFTVLIRNGATVVVLARVAATAADNGDEAPPADVAGYPGELRDKLLTENPTLGDPPPAAPIDVPTLGERLATAQAIAGDAPIATSVSEPISPDGGTVISTAPAEPVTPEDRLRFELGCHQKRAAKLQELSQKYMRLSSEATTLQSDLNDKREEMKETAKLLASLAGTPVELQQPIPFGQAAADKPAASEDLLADPAPQEMWGFSGDQCRGFVELAIDPEEVAQALAASRIQPSEKPQAVQAVTVYEAPYLVIDGEEGGPFLLVRLLTKDEWATLHEAKFGRCVIGFDQSPEAKEDRQKGGELCGLVVKVGRKQLVVGPRPEEALALYDDAGAPGIDPADGKSAAAG